jgi:hypothetical protein
VSPYKYVPRSPLPLRQGENDIDNIVSTDQDKKSNSTNSSNSSSNQPQLEEIYNSIDFDQLPYFSPPSNKIELYVFYYL